MSRIFAGPGLVLLFAVAACGSDAPPDAPKESGQPQEQLLTGRDILQASEAAMADIGPFVVESRSWFAYANQPTPDTIIRIFDGTAETSVNPSDQVSAGCQVTMRDVVPFSQRTLGSPFPSNLDMGGTTPGAVELLGREVLDGVLAWVIRYDYEDAHFEGPIPIGIVEWIAADDFRLLRVETERWDRGGFSGQIVEVFTTYGTQDPATCPRDSSVPAKDLEPTTEPRLQPPSRP